MNAPRFPELKKGPDGKYLCRGCGGPITAKYRRTWCSDACVRKYDPRYVNTDVWKRDGGKCVMCGVKVNNRYGKLATSAEYDHIVPHCEGGKHVLENIRLLCHECHKKRTAEWRRTRNQK